MKLRELTLDQIGVLYKTRLEKDFPPLERRPLSYIRKMYEKGEYEGLALVDEGGTDKAESFDVVNVLAYIFLIREEPFGKPMYLVDYIAVDREKRGLGLGTILLKKLSEYLAGAECVFGEVENPDYAESPEEKEEMERRIRFYLRSGIRDTGASVLLYHVEYRFLEATAGRQHTREEILDIAEYFYRRMLPPHLFDRWVLLHRD